MVLLSNTSLPLHSDDPIPQFFRSKHKHHRSYFVIHYAALCKEVRMDVIIITIIYSCVGVNTCSVYAYYAYYDYNYDYTCSYYPSFR